MNDLTQISTEYVGLRRFVLFRNGTGQIEAYDSKGGRIVTTGETVSEAMEQIRCKVTRYRKRQRRPRISGPVLFDVKPGRNL